MGGFVLAGSDGSFVVELAAKADGQFGSLKLTRSEKHCAPRQWGAGIEQDALEDPLASLERGHALLTDRDAVTRESRAVVVIDIRRPIRAEDEIATPTREFECETDATLSFAVDRNRLIPDFPSIAVRTMKHATPVHLANAW